MFERSSESYDNFKQRVQTLCESGSYQFVLKADIASYFDKIYQHIIGNLLKSSSADNTSVSFLERLLLHLSQNDSHGIVQGIFPSDFLGNFALCDVDAQHSIQGLEFARYVDDMYIFFPTLNEARIHKIRLSNWLSADGLTLNESKTKIFKVEDLLHEETEIDKLFEAAKEEIVEGTINVGYDSNIFWDLETNEEYDDDDLKLEAIKNLFNIELEPFKRNKIDKFCLPVFSAFDSDYALQYVLENFANEPSMAQIYFGYLRKMIVTNKVSNSDIELLLKHENLIFDYQKKWVYATLLYSDNLSKGILKEAVKDLLATEKNVGLRALCAIIIGKNGSSALRRILKTHYAKENSEYVKSAILYAAQYFPSQERDTCYKAWAGHSETNSLIVKALKNKASA